MIDAPLRLVLTCPMPPPRTGAGAIPKLLHAQLTALRSRHEVTLITVAGPGEDELEAVEDLRRDGVDVRAVARHAHEHARTRWRRRGRLATAWAVRRYPWRSAWYWEPAMGAALAGRAAEGPVDVLHAEDNAVGMYAYSYAPALLTEHEVRRPRPASLAGDDPLGRRLLREADWRRWPGYERSVWRRFGLLQVFSARDAEAMTEIAPELAGRIRVNPFSTEIPPACDPASERDGELVFMGNHSHPPNVDAALWLAREILPALRRVRPGARLILIGDQMPDAVRLLDGGPVEVLGRVPDPRPWLERAAVVMAPVRIGGGMRMKVLEAMASGKAVVTTTRGVEGMPSAPVLRADTTGAQVEAIAGLLADRAARRRLGEDARAYAIRHHSPEAHLARLEQAYAELLHAGRAVVAK